MPIQINEVIIRANVVEQDEANKQDVNSYSAQASAKSSATSVYVEKRRKER